MTDDLDFAVTTIKNCRKKKERSKESAKLKQLKQNIFMSAKKLCKDQNILKVSKF